MRLSFCARLVVLMFFFCAVYVAHAEQNRPPNFVFLFCDNLGYGDTQPYGSSLNRTPELIRMAKEGRKFTDFYVPAGVCTPSRASFLTGCYPRRVNMHQSDLMGANRWPMVNRTPPEPSHSAVLWPASAKGLHPEERTIAEALKPSGYTSICIGKWHLGDQPAFLPTEQGFDEFLGIPYSEGMMAHWDDVCPPLPLMHNTEVVEAPVDCNTLTKRYTERSVEFIHQHADKPFFLYLAHAMPGSIPDAFASEDFKGKSKGGPWGDKVEEIDWSTGKILDAINEAGIAEHTFVIWTSDNGAGKLAEGSRGSNLPLKGWGYSTSEAAMRVPCIMWWPGKIPPGTVCSEVVTTMDLLPTFEKLSHGAKPPASSVAETQGEANRVIDGKDIWPLIANEAEAKSPHEAFYYYYMDQLQAVRSGKWKLYLALDQKRTSPVRYVSAPEIELYDLVDDLAETNNVAQEYPEVVARLQELAERAREDLGDRDRPGSGQREAGFVENPTPRLIDEQ